MKEPRSFSIGNTAYSSTEFQRLSKARQAALMIEWFGERYEDPIHHLPYNSREGGYQWIHGGPYSARSVLENEFGNLAKPSAIAAAIEDLETEGFDWSPRPEEEPDDGIYSINEPLPDISDFDFEEDDDEVATRTDVAALRGDMLKKLEELEALILAARPLHGGVGHNNPPAPIDELPISAADLDQSLDAIRSLRDQAYADEPDETQVLRGASRFRRVAAALGGWLGGRANAVVDAGLTPLVTASLGAAAYAYGLQLLAALESAANSVLEWFHAVMPMF